MSNTYSQIYIHCVFAVQYRMALLQNPWDEEVRRYITGIVQNKGHKMIAINNMPDHLHMLVGLNPSQSISDMMRLAKGESSEWINKQQKSIVPFHWQEGYGAFSHSRSQIDGVVKYIQNQQEHHAKFSFINEYKDMLQKFDVAFEDQYIFREPE